MLLLASPVLTPVPLSEMLGSSSAAPHAYPCNKILLQLVLILTIIRTHITHKAGNQTPQECACLTLSPGSRGLQGREGMLTDALGTLPCCVTFPEVVTFSGLLLHHL